MSIVHKGGQCYYLVDRPKFTEDEHAFLDVISRVALKKFSIREMEQVFLTDKRAGTWLHAIEGQLVGKLKVHELTLEPSILKDREELVSKFVKKHLPKSSNQKELTKEVTNMLCGVGMLSQLIADDELEEIMINGTNKPVRVFHRKHGACKTNIIFHSSDKLLVLLSRIASSEGKELTRANPIVDARMVGGPRVNITVPPASTSPTLTIRKFSFKPFSLLDIVKFGTITPEVASFLWLAVEGLNVLPMNLIISGGAGSGKTTTLNALSSFIPFDNRVLTIEDTLELNLGGRDNWVQLEATYDYKSKTEITMNDLVKASLRMRPDRIMVGEVRGPEAMSLFTAMDVGITGSMGTLHANDAKETLLRLRSPPMNVHKQLLSLLDVIVIQHRFRSEGGGVQRRVTEISEVSWMGDQVLLNGIYKWDKGRDVLSRTQLPSQTIEKLAFAGGMNKKEVMERMNLRKGILDWMLEQDLSYVETVNLFNEFYSDRDGFLNKITSF